MSTTAKAWLLGRTCAALVADLAAVVAPLVPRRHRHAWVPTELARGSWPSEPGLDICARNPSHTRRRNGCGDLSCDDEHGNG